MILKKIKQKGQSEMVGFALIIVIVAVLILIFLGFSMRGNGDEMVQSYEIESFIQAVLQYTTQCENNLEHLTIQKLIISCEKEESCLNNEEACSVLENTITGIVDSSWKSGEDRPIKGYVLNITSEYADILSLKVGNKTNSMRGTSQDLGRAKINILFEVYS